MELSLQALEEAGLRARGQVGDPDPNVALEDALRIFAADEIVISTHPPDRSHGSARWVAARRRPTCGHSRGRRSSEAEAASRSA